MLEYKSVRLNRFLLKSWHIQLDSAFLKAIDEFVDPETAQRIRNVLELSLPKEWKFGKKWYSKKIGAIFILQPRRNESCLSYPAKPASRFELETTSR